MVIGQSFKVGKYVSACFVRASGLCLLAFFALSPFSCLFFSYT